MAAEGAARGRAQGRSRARARRRRRRDHLSSSSEEEEEEERSEEDPQIYERQFFWTCYRESGFPNRVNHAVASHRDADGSYYLYSVGGYHADDDERTVVQADTAGGPFFRSSPIDIHCLDVGKPLPCCPKHDQLCLQTFCLRPYQFGLLIHEYSDSIFRLLLMTFM